ncbi:Uncharacterized protein TCAP_02444 [Tolypocladium capitatum]|uniref:Uncharacterized protein n=1 Tax=Tolypocladium capitatum TaxID=45235 RepID=A0A2K3QJF7_9HYPO|nr:Uncharacterized protein TCAP_02444 [Tolypocladium capitatum]
MSALQKALPLALAVFCGVLGGRFAACVSFLTRWNMESRQRLTLQPSYPGYYTFQPVLAPKDLPGEAQAKTRNPNPRTVVEAKPSTAASEKG